MIKIGPKEIDLIKDFARKSFHSTPKFIGMTPEEIQVACILVGLEVFMNTKGIPVEYEVKLKEDHDSLPVDDDGLGVTE